MRASLLVAICTTTAMGVACSRESDVDKVPVGTEVQVVRQDGALVQGKLAARDEHAVKVDVGKTTRSVPREDIASVRVTPPDAPAEPPASARFRELTVPEGTQLTVKLASSVGSATSSIEIRSRPKSSNLCRSMASWSFRPAAALRGDITEAQPSGKVGTRGARLCVQHDDDRGRAVSDQCALRNIAESTPVDDAKKIGCRRRAERLSARSSAARRAQRSAHAGGGVQPWC